MEKIKIKFPNDEIYDFEQGRPIVILGANGSGKTRLGVEIEKLNDENFSNAYNKNSLLVQRISAQKSLSISETIPILGYEASERNAFIGNAEVPHASKNSFKYNRNPSTHLVDDYNKVLSFFFAKNNRQLEEHRVLEQDSMKRGKERPWLIKTFIEQAVEIWNELLPGRDLDLFGNEVHAIGSSRYHGKEMSDGERVILYMIIQAISVKPGSILLIDEPELHIHKAIVNKLWDRLEEMRQDCVFIYITHDLDFAVSRDADKVLWVKSFDGGNKWEYEFIDLLEYANLPENLFYEIIGTRKKIMFVEGTKDSLDYHLYKELYRDQNYHVIPCGGCQEVINYVKAKNGYDKLNAISVIGIIDRDFRTENEIQGLKKDGIYVLDVAEVENLFVVPELIEIMVYQLGCDETVIEAAKDLVCARYSGQRANQISEAFVKEVDFQMSMTHFFDYSLGVEKIKGIIDKKFTSEYISRILEEKKDVFIETDDLKKILRIFNYKDLSDMIGKKFGCEKKEYPRRVIRLLRNDEGGSRQRIIDALKPYLPELP